MSKIDLLFPEITRVSSTETLTVDFQLDFTSLDITSSVALSFVLSDTNTFASVTTANPASFIWYNGGTGTTVTGNTLTTSMIDKKIRVTLPAIGAEKVKYMKIAVDYAGKKFVSKPFILTSVTEINVTKKTPINTGTTRPSMVRVMDSMSVKSNAGRFTIKVEACNNALDTTPTWENITTAYLASSYYTFTNKTKTNANWGISVRYSIKKLNTKDEVELSEYYITYL